MSRYSKNRLFPALLVAIIVIVAVVAVVSITRALFFSGAKEAATQVDTSREALLNIGRDRKVRMTVRGPIVAEEKFHSYQITVSAEGRSLTTYQGYVGTPIDSVTLSNSGAAYDEFVHALDKANLSKGTAFEGDKDDTRGICATGRVYEYEIMYGTSTVKRLWTSTCRGSAGSLSASVEQLTNLFVKQIPDSRALLQKIDL